MEHRQDERKEVINRIYELWSAVPEMRLGQLIDNATHNKSSGTYFLSDKELVNELENYMNKFHKK